jgi:hypothetical protein
MSSQEPWSHKGHPGREGSGSAAPAIGMRPRRSVAVNGPTQCRALAGSLGRVRRRLSAPHQGALAFGRSEFSLQLRRPPVFQGSAFLCLKIRPGQITRFRN